MEVRGRNTFGGEFHSLKKKRFTRNMGMEVEWTKIGTGTTTSQNHFIILLLLIDKARDK